MSQDKNKDDIINKIYEQELSEDEAVELLWGEKEKSIEKHNEDQNDLLQDIENYVVNKVTPLVPGSASKISLSKNFMDLGVDSSNLIEMSRQIEKELSIELYPTLFFEYQNIKELSKYFKETFPEAFESYFHKQEEREVSKKTAILVKKENIKVTQPAKKIIKTIENKNANKDIAIIGMAGRFAEAVNVNEFWQNIEQSKDLITEVPADRWDAEQWFDPDKQAPNKTYSKWGSFIKAIDKFDPQFFGISPKEAVWMDPQLRLLLEVIYECTEDAGYCQKINGSDTGLFLGVMYHQYWDEIIRGGTSFIDYQHSSSVMSSLTGRICYTFDLKGPGIPLDNACASSLTALHLACKTLQRGESQMAFVAGSNLLISPLQYVYLSRIQALSPTGHCYAFDKKANGYVPGEGVAALLLKPLEKAILDNDNIYAVVKGSAINHVGRSNNPTSPRPELQTEVIVKAWKDADINPETLSFLEAHGTGTELGDPIEITALKKAFGQYTDKKNFCFIGSTKAHIGHCEGAAGLASLIKTILAIKHKKIPRMPDFEELNPYIKMEDSPFKINTSLVEWRSSQDFPRRAGISSFGMTGNNAHVVIEEFNDTQREGVSTTKKIVTNVFIISAKGESSLREYTKKYLAFTKDTRADLDDILYSLQTGREYFKHRLAIICKDKKDLSDKLELFLNSISNDDIVSGVCEDAEEKIVSASPGVSGKEIAGNWIKGAKIEWRKMYEGNGLRKVSLPTYPFEEKRYWYADHIRKIDHLKIQGEKVKEENPFIFYTTTWEKENFQNNRRGIQGNILLFDSNKNLYNELIRKNKVILVQPGDKFFKEDNDIFIINPEQENDYRQLISALNKQSFKPDTILHNWASFFENTFNPEDFGEYLSYSVYSIYFIISNLAQNDLKPQKILYFYHGNQINENPVFESVNAFSKSIGQVLPELDFCTIKIDANEPAPTSILNIIRNESSGDNSNNKFIFYKGEDRYVKKVQLLSLYDDAQLLHKTGVYLITGGLGGLGKIFTQYLLHQYQARVILLGRSALNNEKKKIIDELSQNNGEVIYLQADVTDEKNLTEVLQTIRLNYNGLNGIIHAAGSVTSQTILDSDFDTFNTALSSKIVGTINLDNIFGRENLDFFICFSSSSSILGDLGQCSYAIGNAFQDSFCRYREELRSKGERNGRTIAINWPLWREGGMHFNRDAEKLYLQSSGMKYLEEAEGIECFEKMTSSCYSNIGVFSGIEEKIKRFLGIQQEKHDVKEKDVGTKKQPVKVPAKKTGHAADMKENVEKDIIQIAATLLMSEPSAIDPNGNLGDFGFDSITLKDLSVKISDTYGIKVTPSVFFAHSSIKALSKHLTDTFAEKIAEFYSHNVQGEENIESAESEEMLESESKIEYIQDNKKQTEVAIIGISGIFPQSKNLDEFWKHLENQDDLITEVPIERWDWREYYGDSLKGENKTLSKWGGFIDDVDKFDPLFFNISPGEAEMMDPQHRLFLQTVWHTFEDAGYKISDFSGKNVGVFVGAQFTDYYDMLKRFGISNARTGTGNSHAVLANRISFSFNFHGPSEAIDTACSSGLVAFHRAVKSIQHGESEIAVAGGVSLMLTPDTMIAASQMGIISPDGRCKTFDKRANGYVKGEGVGAFLLKPLQKAMQDHDQIYAVVKATAVNHGGAAHSLTAPNSEAQAVLIASACKDGNIDPETITYIETHGTGTELGDPVEIEGLKKAFLDTSKERDIEIRRSNYCGIGSVKTNAGHFEPAAGTVGLMKLILAIKNKKLPGLVNFKERNPYIELEKSPFYIVEKTKEWERLKDEQGNEIPRRAGVSSFGFGGTNAHAIIEEYTEKSTNKNFVQKKHAIVLSAKSEEQLRRYAKSLQHVIKKNTLTDDDMARIAYTLQTGREAIEYRLAIIATNINDVKDRIEDFHKNIKADGLYWSKIEKGHKQQQVLNDIDKIAELWVLGHDVDWKQLYESIPQKISLPTYPFAGKRYWIPQIRGEASISQTRQSSLHPLLTQNISTLKEQKFKTILSNKDFFIKDHIVSGQMILPAVACLEMARAAADLALENQISGFTNIVWSQPVVVENTKGIFINLYPGKDIGFRIYSGGKNRIQHCQGILLLNTHAESRPDKVNITDIRNRCAKKINSEEFYKAFTEQGFKYGAGFRAIKELYHNEKEVFAEIVIPELIKSTFKDFILHPSIIDAALQSIVGFYLARDMQHQVSSIPCSLRQLEMYKSIANPCFIYATMPNDDGVKSDNDVNSFNIRLLDTDGLCLVDIQEIALKQPDKQKNEINQADTFPNMIDELIGKVVEEKISPDEAARVLEEIHD